MSAPRPAAQALSPSRVPIPRHGGSLLVPCLWPPCILPSLLMPVAFLLTHLHCVGFHFIPQIPLLSGSLAKHWLEKENKSKTEGQERAKLWALDAGLASCSSKRTVSDRNPHLSLWLGCTGRGVLPGPDCTGVAHFWRTFQWQFFSLCVCALHH